MRLFAALDRRLNAIHGLTLTEVRFLGLLATSDTGAIQKSELCQALMVPPGRLAQMFQHLRPRGLVVPSAAPHDRRGVSLSITDLGRARFETVRKTLTSEVRTHFLNGMSHPQMLALIDGHRRIGKPASVPESEAAGHTLANREPAVAGGFPVVAAHNHQNAEVVFRRAGMNNGLAE